MIKALMGLALLPNLKVLKTVSKLHFKTLKSKFTIFQICIKINVTCTHGKGGLICG